MPNAGYIGTAVKGGSEGTRLMPSWMIRKVTGRLKKNGARERRYARPYSQTSSSIPFHPHHLLLFALCSLPLALCPLPFAFCPLPLALCILDILLSLWSN